MTIFATRFVVVSETRLAGVQIYDAAARFRPDLAVYTEKPRERERTLTVYVASGQTGEFVASFTWFRSETEFQVMEMCAVSGTRGLVLKSTRGCCIPATCLLDKALCEC